MVLLWVLGYFCVSGWLGYGGKVGCGVLYDGILFVFFVCRIVKIKVLVVGFWFIFFVIGV